MKIIILFLLILSCLNSSLTAQVKETNKRSIFESNNYYESDSTNTRVFFSSLLISNGYPEAWNFIRIGYQFNNRFSLALRLSLYVNNLGGKWNFGTPYIALETAKYFPKKWLFNNIKVISGAGGEGWASYLLDLSTGYESTSDRTINAYYAVGFCLQVYQKHEPFFVPNIKVGLTINF